MEKSKKENELISLNENLYNEFFVQELETRLETDPLLSGELLSNTSLDTSGVDVSCFCNLFCAHCSFVLPFCFAEIQF